MIWDLIISRKYNKTVRSNNSFALVVPKLKHYGERSFSYAAPIEWYKIYVEIRSLTKFETFKKNVKTYLYNIAFTSLHVIFYNVRYCVYFYFTSVVFFRVFIEFICIR